MKKLCALILDLYFYADILTLIAVVVGMEHMGFAVIKLLILPFYKYWFIIVYILLFILSPILNAGIESLNKMQSMFLTVFFTALFCCLGFVSEATFISLNDGYSLMFAMYLYFLGRMMNKWNFLKRSQGKQVFYWIASSISTAVGCTALVYLKKSQFAWKMFSYNQLFIVLAAVNFVWIFLNLPEKNDGGKYQRIAKHILPVYYIHTCTVFSYYRNIPLKWIADNVAAIWQIPFLIIYAILIFAVCIIIDKIKTTFLWKTEDKIIDSIVSCIDRYILKGKIDCNYSFIEIQRADTIDHAYVNAEVDDGSDTAKLMEYFKTTDPEDTSQGDLSKRVHLLKCEKGGWDEMCEVSEKWYKEGEAVGEMKAKQETALNMKKKGYPDTTIADILEVGVATVQQWLSKKPTVAR